MRSYLIAQPDRASCVGDAIGGGAAALVLTWCIAGRDTDRMRDQAVARCLEAQSIGAPMPVFLAVSRELAIEGDVINSLIQMRPAGIVVDGIDGLADIQEIDGLCAVAEAIYDLPDGQIKIVAVVTNPAGVQMCMTLRPDFCIPRLTGLGWNADALAASMGASQSRDAQGFSGPFCLARSAVLLAARASHLTAIDTPCPCQPVAAGTIKLETEQAAAMGYDAKFATSPEQATQICRAASCDVPANAPTHS